MNISAKKINEDKWLTLYVTESNLHKQTLLGSYVRNIRNKITPRELPVEGCESLSIKPTFYTLISTRILHRFYTSILLNIALTRALKGSFLGVLSNGFSSFVNFCWRTFCKSILNYDGYWWSAVDRRNLEMENVTAKCAVIF